MKFIFSTRAILRKFQDHFFPFQTEYVRNRFPKHLKNRRIYVLLEDKDPWEARFLCPCGCCDQVDLSLLPDDHPTWTVTSDVKNRATLHPSVWRTVRCRSHFFIRDGKVIWV